MHNFIREFKTAYTWNYRLWLIYSVFRYDIPRFFKPSTSSFLWFSIDKLPTDNAFHKVQFSQPKLISVTGNFRRQEVYGSEIISIDGVEVK